MSPAFSSAGDYLGDLAEEHNTVNSDFQGAAGDAKCEFFDIADSDADNPTWASRGHLDLERAPVEYWDVPLVQLAFLEFQESKARCRRMEALYYEAKEKDANSGAAQGPGGGEAIYESFMMDSEEEPSGSDEALEDGESGSLSDSFGLR